MATVDIINCGAEPVSFGTFTLQPGESQAVEFTGEMVLTAGSILRGAPPVETEGQAPNLPGSDA